MASRPRHAQLASTACSHVSRHDVEARRRGDGVEGNATGAARGGRRKVTWQKGAAQQRQPAESAPSEGASRISNSGGHERRSSVQQAQSRWPWSRPARPHTRGDRPWCKNSRLFLSVTQKRSHDPARSVLRSCSTRLHSAPPHARRSAWRARGGLTPPFTSPSPPFTHCYRRGPFWPAYGATARAPLPSESPT